MKFVARFFLWILRIVSMLGCIAFVVLAICGFGLIRNLFLASLCLTVFIVAVKFGKKAKKACNTKCNKCGASVVGADYKYKYSLDKAKITKGGGVDLPVDIVIICPRCKKEKSFYETLYFVNMQDAYPDHVRREVHDLVNRKMNGN